MPKRKLPESPSRVTATQHGRITKVPRLSQCLDSSSLEKPQPFIETRSEEPPIQLPSPSLSEFLRHEEPPERDLAKKSHDRPLRRSSRLRKRPLSKNGSERRAHSVEENSTSSINNSPNQHLQNKRKFPPTHTCAEDIASQKRPKLIEDEIEEYNPIRYWAEHRSWPPDFAEKIFDMDDSSGSNVSLKRSRTSSYSQSVKEGEAPEQYTAAYETWIQTKGLDMNPIEGERLVSSDSEKLCKSLLKIKRKSIKPSVFPEGVSREVLNLCRNRNEAIVQRDVTPMILPTIAALYYSADESLKDVVDEVNANWYEQCVLAGPRIRPDLTVGFSKSAFSEAEINKLNAYTSVDNWTRFTDNLYFPFLMCEVKCGRESLALADRQNMHSSSVALRALLGIEQEADRYRTAKALHGLNGRILVFSISHDQEDVRVYGHFVVMKNDKWVYYRRPIETFGILAKKDDLLAAHNLARNILEFCVPLHLKRLKHTLSFLPEPTTLSFAVSSMALEADSQSNSQEQNSSKFKKPGRAASTIQNETIAKLTEQMKEQREQMEQQLEQQKQDSKKREEMMAKQMEQQKEQMEQIINLLRSKK